MPTYEFAHSVEDCKNEWEEWLSMSAPNPTHCPKCNAEGNITKLISLGSKGVVELYGHDLVDKIKGDVRQLKKDAAADSKVYANLLGEEKYQAIQTKMDDQKRIRRSK
jgi:putative FmdB family regulatory protein